jgi:ubiquinone/menaquinone biosynthesis C-methylase UbiE
MHTEEENIMDKPMANLMFNGMSLMFKLRDFLQPRKMILDEVGIKPGDRVLDYACGPGAYIADTVERVGESGRVYALDIHPLAVQRVREIATRQELSNVETICSDCDTGLPDTCLDVVLLYDVFHMLSNPQAILAELHRVLKPDGVLSFQDPHMREDDIIAGVTYGQAFRLTRRGKHTYQFERV